MLGTWGEGEVIGYIFEIRRGFYFLFFPFFFLATSVRIHTDDFLD